MDKIKNRIDVRFLTETLAVQSYSKDDSEMLTYIKNQLVQLNITVEEDGYGNIYVTKGFSNDYPCLVAHIDTVQTPLEGFGIFKDGDTLFAFDSNKRKQCGIGGDDKVGVYMLLQALLDIPILKTVFYRDEEIGCLGSTYSILNHKDWYDNCNFIIQPDRRDYYDLITNSAGLEITSKEFLEEIKEISDKYEYVETMGVCTDVDRLISKDVGVSCLNISCGYINPHSASEIVSIAGVNAAYNFVYDVISEFAHRKFNYTAPLRPIYKGWKKDSGFYSSLFDKRKDRIIGTEQLELFGPALPADLSLYASILKYENFELIGQTKSKANLYKYIGIKAIPFAIDVSCGACKEFRTLFYMPYEGRIFCTKCNDFATNEDDLNLFKYLEVDDNDMTFVFSVYADSWMEKPSAKWDDNLTCWVPNDMPF
jgi:tripeptide aminopeptidase